MWYKVTNKVTNVYFVEASSEDEAIEMATTNKVSPVLGPFGGPVKEDISISDIKNKGCVDRTVKRMESRAILEERRNRLLPKTISRN